MIDTFKVPLSFQITPFVPGSEVGRSFKYNLLPCNIFAETDVMPDPPITAPLPLSVVANTVFPVPPIIAAQVAVQIQFERPPPIKE